MRLDLSVPFLRAQYINGSLTPSQLVTTLHAHMLAEDEALNRNIWIRRLSLEELRVYAKALDGQRIVVADFKEPIGTRLSWYQRLLEQCLSLRYRRFFLCHLVSNSYACLHSCFRCVTPRRLCPPQYGSTRQC